MYQGGVTDLATAKGIARKLHASYGMGGNFDKSAMERMMMDTYRILNKQYRPTHQDIGVYGSILDFDQDGKISVEDFEKLAIKYLVKNETRAYTKKVRERLEVAERLFRQFDLDGDGYLGEKQIPNIIIETYKMMGTEIKPTQEDVHSWMQMTDLDGDGKVTLQDYERLIISSLEKVGIKIYERQ